MQPIAAGVTSLEIEEGRVSVFYAPDQPEALTLTAVDGTLFAPPHSNSYRFNGRVSQKSQHFDIKFLAAAAAGGSGVKLTGSVLDLASKTVFQADGVLGAGNAPAFEGAVAFTAPQAAALAGAPFEVQVKARANINPAGLALSDLVLTMDPENRPQILIGSANAAFAAKTADIAFHARSLDADGLLAGGNGLTSSAAAPAGWGNIRAVADRLLWLYPDFGLRLSFAADQVQLRGELIEGVKVEGARNGQRWVFDGAQAALPGETAIKLAGAFAKVAGKSELTALASLEGKNLGRLNRWIAPPAANARPAPARAFTLKGLLTLSDEVTAFTNVAGDVDGTPFTANLRLDKAPIRKLQVSLAGDSFDLSSLETGQSGADALSAESAKAAWQAGLAQLAPVLGDDPASFDMADVDVSAGSIKTSFIEARNVAIQLKFNRDLLTVTKLSAETADGLSLRGEGVVPLRGAGQGRFDGRVEARSAPAVLKVAALAGYDADSLSGRRAEDFAPALLSINYGAEAQAANATAQVNGNLGAARVDGRVQLKGGLADWRTGRLSVLLGVSAIDGDKLVALLFPRAVFTAAALATPGNISIRADGTSERLDTSASIKAAALQAQIDGTAEIKAGSLAFNGKALASSPAPEQFLPPVLLALLGGERQGNLRVETNLAFGPGHIDAAKLKAESAKNLVTGRLAIGTADRSTHVDADLKADQLSLPVIMGYVLTQPPPDRFPLVTAANGAAPSQGIWSDRPFALSTFQDTTAKIMLAAKTMKLGDAFVVTDAQLAARLENSRLDVEKLEGKAMGGELAASLNLNARGGAVSADARIFLSNADLSALPSSGSPPIVTGRASLSLRASGQGLSPRGLLPVLQGRGSIALSDGQLSKFSPRGVQKSAEDMLAAQQPLNEDAIKKKVLEASQSGDFKFHHLTIPVTIRDGMLEIRRASFRNREGTVRMEAYLDLSTMQADSTWQAGVSSDRRAKWPPVKVQLSGPLRELGGRPRTLAAEDFVRAVLIGKMEGDITRLESLNKAPQAAATPSWPAKQEPAPKPARRKRDQENPPAAQAGAAAGAPSEFEKRMRDALQSKPRPDGP